MNDKWSDQIFDSMLEEVVTGVHPPDLTERIESAWKRENDKTQKVNGTAKLVVAKAVAAPQQPVACDSSLSIETNNKFTKHRNSWHLPALCVAASVLFVLASVQFWRMSNEGQGSNRPDTGIAFVPTPIVPDRSTNGPYANQSTNDNHVATSDAVGERISAVAGKDGSTSEVEQESLPLENLPFGHESALSQNNSSKSDSLPRAPAQARSESANISKLAESQIVELIDSQMRVLWNKHAVVPASALDADQLVRRTYVRLTGVEPGLAEIAQHISDNTIASRTDLINSLVSSPEFAAHWSDVFLRRIMSGTDAANSSTAAGKILREALSQSVLQRASWNVALASLLDSSIATVNSAEEKIAADRVFLGSLAGGGSHRLAARVGTGMLDRAIACARCHDAQLPGTLQTIGQESYWSLVALLMGLEPTAAGTEYPGPSILDKQLDLIAKKAANPFFELTDGRMQRAELQLPDGQPWNAIDDSATPRQALAQWLIASSEIDSAIVNQAWRIVFGRPLVPAAQALDDLGLSERYELLSVLSSQLRLYNHDVGKLVGWLASSEAFTFGPSAVDRQTWLLASEQAKIGWSKAEMAFAATGLLGTTADSKTLATSLTAVVNWNAIERQQDQRRLLAQPDTTPSTQKSKSKSSTAIRLEGPSMAFLVHASQKDGENVRYVDRLLKSKLNWKEQVQHVVGLTGDMVVNRQVEQLADRLQKESAGGAREALLKLLWAVRNHDAS